MSAVAVPLSLHTIPETLAFHALQQPDRPALLDVNGAVASWATLARENQRIARWLRSRAIGPTDAVLLACPDGLLATTLTLGIATGACVVPVDPDLQSEEAGRLLDDLGAAALICVDPAAPVARRAAQLGMPVVAAAIEQDGRIRLAGSLLAGDGPIIVPNRDADAWLLHTSGTTGRPRRVPCRHRSLLPIRRRMCAEYGIAADDVAVNVASVRRTAGLAVLLMALQSGSRTVCAEAYDPLRFPDWLAAFGATWFMAVPSVLRDLAERLAARPGLAASLHLRRVMSAGAPIAGGEQAAIEAVLGAPVLNVYGMSEATPIAAERTAADRRSGSVGRPVFDVQIVDGAGRPVAPGEAGEVVTRGPHVFAGYRDDPAATAKAFTPDGWFRTGDLGCFDADGYLFLTGREKELINYGGEKIAPAEVDDALRTHPAVADAAAFPLPHPRLGEIVGAAIVLRPGADATPRALRRWLLDRLSSHKAPRQIWIVDALPRTPTGKVRRADLTRRFAPGGNAAATAPSQIEHA